MGAMRRSAFLVVALLTVGCDVQGPPGAEGPTVAPGRSATLAERPNLLFIVTDDQRFDMLGAVHPFLETPNMDRLATEGVRFENAFVTTPAEPACSRGWSNAPIDTPSARHHSLSDSLISAIPSCCVGRAIVRASSGNSVCG